MSEELSQEIAEQVLALHPSASKATWGKVFLALAADEPDLEQWLDSKLIASLGNYVTQLKSRQATQRRNERLISLGVSTATGRPISPTISVRMTDGSRQGVLWVEASPAQFVEAVFREQAVVDGRAESNAIRMQLAEILNGRKSLMGLPTLGAVCEELEINPDTLGLEDLEAM